MNIPCIHQAHLCPQGLKSRKGTGTTACLEKARSREAVVAAEGQDKTCMAKATLPESQSPVILLVMAPQNGCRGVPVRNVPDLTAGTTFDPAGTPSITKGKGTNGTPEHVAPAISRNHGMPCSRRRTVCLPVWARSRHSTRTPGVTAGTAVPDIRRTDDAAYKSKATSAKAFRTGGRTAVPATATMSDGVC